jgi:hypothetical protein
MKKKISRQIQRVGTNHPIESITPPNPQSKQIEPNPSAIFQVACNHYIHQNTLMWNVFFRSVTLQLSILAGAYTFRGTYFSPLVLISGTVLIVVFSFLAKKYQEDRDYNLKFINNLAQLLIPQDKSLDISKNSMFPFSEEAKGIKYLFTGKSIATIVIGGFAAINFFVAISLLINLADVVAWLERLEP